MTLSCKRPHRQRVWKGWGGACWNNPTGNCYGDTDSYRDCLHFRINSNSCRGIIPGCELKWYNLPSFPLRKTLASPKGSLELKLLDHHDVVQTIICCLQQIHCPSLQWCSLAGDRCAEWGCSRVSVAVSPRSRKEGSRSGWNLFTSCTALLLDADQLWIWSDC